mmetsp:Transcript_4749/g.8542  ORF Transcript_4749/g.8542 Transcript_4749/m.8542 type:complete len:85 (+) Transcript_4749:5228-5482(+)
MNAFILESMLCGVNTHINIVKSVAVVCNCIPSSPCNYTSEHALVNLYRITDSSQIHRLTADESQIHRVLLRYLEQNRQIRIVFR